MSAAQARAVGTLVFGAYNIANGGLRQEKFHDVSIFFHDVMRITSQESASFSKKGLNFFGVKRMLGEHSGQV